MKLLRKTKLRLKNKLGITLVEIVIVVAILSIMGWVAVSTFMNHYNLQWVW